MRTYTNDTKYLWTHQHYKMLILAFKITCILRSAIDRYIPGTFGKVSLEPSCIYTSFSITLMSI